MHPIIYYIIFLIILGGLGMAIANKKAQPFVRRLRWRKYFAYIIITSAVITVIFFNFFFWLALIIIAISFAELINASISYPSVRKSVVVLSFIVFLLIASGFILFAHIFNQSFLLFIYFQILVFDGFCQITGQLFGKHQLVPGISPAKTWEGLIGGWLFCIVAGIFTDRWLGSGFTPGIFGALAGLLTGLTSLYGDLLASFYKRKVHIKDYGDWLPGQGGVLDRFDSLLFTGFVYYLLYILIFREEFSKFIITANQ